MSGRRCPLPGSAVGAAARMPADRARARAPHTGAALGVPGSTVPSLARRHCIWGRGSRRPRSPTHLLPALAAAQSCGRDAQGTPPPPPPCRPRESCVVETDARGRQYQTWGRVCSPIPGGFHFQSLHSKMQSSLQRSALKLSNSVEKQLYPTYMFYFVFPTDFIYI